MTNPPPGYHSVSPYLMAEDLEGLVSFVCEVFGEDGHASVRGWVKASIRVADHTVTRRVRTAKLCAALSTFWPAAAPDATRTMEPALTPITVAPLTDEEIGQRPGSIPWDGVHGPTVGTDANGATVAGRSG